MQSPQPSRPKRKDSSPATNPTTKKTVPDSEIAMDPVMMQSLMAQFQAMLDKSLADALKPIQETLMIMKFDMESVKTEARKQHTEIRELKERLRISEDRNRSQNLRFGGIRVTAGENCFDIVADFCDRELGVKSVSLNKAHRTSKYPDAQIIANFTFDSQVQEIWENVRSGKAKKSGVFVMKDYSRETLDIRSKLKAFIQPARDQGQKVTLGKDSLNINGQTFVLDLDGNLTAKQIRRGVTRGPRSYAQVADPNQPVHSGS
jgi:hypothetical protein